MYKGPKVVAMDRREIREAIKQASDWSRDARAIIVIVQHRDGTNSVKSTCLDRWQTLCMLEGAKNAFISR